MPGIGGSADTHLGRQELDEEDRGRDGDRSPPPAQTRTGPMAAKGCWGQGGRTLGLGRKSIAHVHCLFGFVAQTWTKNTTGEILPRHTCSARCGAPRRYDFARVAIGAAPVLNEDRDLTNDL